LASNAAAGHFGGQVGDFPEAVQDLFAAQFPPALALNFLIEELFMRGGTVLEHVGTNTGLGFGVGGSVGVEARGLGRIAVGHGSREDQAGKGYFLIGDEVADFIFGHWWLRFLEEVRAGIFTTVSVRIWTFECGFS
jgi:hypothetical protein